MAFLCTYCKLEVAPEHAVAHQGTHDRERVKEAIGAVNDLPPRLRIEVVLAFEECCGGFSGHLDECHERKGEQEGDGG